MADKYIRRDAVTGTLSETEATDISTGVPDAGEVVALNAAGELDPTMFPAGINSQQVTVNAAVGLTIGDLVFIDSSGEADLASAAVAGVQACGFAGSTELAGDPVVVFFEGIVSGFLALTPGGRVYLSDTAPGDVTQTPVTGAGKLHQLVGKALSATTILFEPDDSVLLA